MGEPKDCRLEMEITNLTEDEANRLEEAIRVIAKTHKVSVEIIRQGKR